MAFKLYSYPINIMMTGQCIEIWPHLTLHDLEWPWITCQYFTHLMFHQEVIIVNWRRILHSAHCMMRVSVLMGFYHIWNLFKHSQVALLINELLIQWQICRPSAAQDWTLHHAWLKNASYFECAVPHVPLFHLFVL